MVRLFGPTRFEKGLAMRTLILAIALSMPLVACQTAANGPLVTAATLQAHDYSLADSPNKRTALAYRYTAWNEGRIAEARQRFWVAGSFPAPTPGSKPADLPKNIGTPKYTIKKVIEEGNQVVVLAFVEGVGIGSRITTIFGTDGGVKIGDAVVEIFEFDKSGLIAKKWDTIQPVSEESYDFR
jgi:hypothetical protein